MIVAVVQARCGSRRLPGKVLAPVLGRPMLLRQIERIRRANAIDDLVVATSTEGEDDRLAALCKERRIRLFRGSLDDVLDRVYHAVLPLEPDHVVRLTGDCPLADPELIDLVVDRHLADDNDYTSNALNRTWPDGLDCEVVRFACLEEAWREAELPSEREHVTPFLYNHRERYRIGSVESEVELPRYRWTVDEEPDLELVMRIYEALYPAKPAFSTADVLELMEKEPTLAEINRAVDRGAGWQRSLEQDEAYRRGESDQ
jgi:spore coat polysaccharide biosynthesis protein SpsF